MMQISNSAQRCYARSAHASCGLGPRRMLREALVACKPLLQVNRIGATFGHSRCICSPPIPSAKAMAPEANDMLSSHAGIEVDVMIEGRPLSGDR